MDGQSEGRFSQSLLLESLSTILLLNTRRPWKRKITQRLWYGRKLSSRLFITFEELTHIYRGAAIGLVHKALPAGEIVKETRAEARRVISELSQRLGADSKI
jgi:hypothetical protein